MPTNTTPAPASNSAPNNPASITEKVPLIDIRPDPRNRKDHDGDLLKVLADQIKKEGLLQPIVIRKLTAKELEHYTKPQTARLAYWPTFQIIAGERRFRAHQMLKAHSIEARIVTADTELSAVVKQTIENVSRVDLNPMDRARQMLRLSELKMPQKEIGKLFGDVSQPVVANTLRLLDLPATVQELVSKGKLSQAHGVILVRWARWKKLCMRIAELAIAHDWDAKSLAGGLPFEGQLEQEGLVVKIRLDNGYSYDRPTYTVPEKLQKDPDFAKIAGYWWYFVPDDPAAENKWAPERDRQDKARATADAARKAKNEKALKNNKPNSEQLARRKKIATNKAARGLLTKTLEAVTSRLKAARGGDPAALALVCAKAAGAAGGSTFDAAAALGIKLPPKFDNHTAAAWMKLSVGDQVRLAAAALAFNDTQEAMRYAGMVPDRVIFLTAAKGGKR